MFLVIRLRSVETEPFLRKPLSFIFNRCLDDFGQRRLSLFSSADLAQQYIYEQRKLQQQYFLMLALENMRQTLLNQILIQRDIGQFFSASPRIHYFSPFSSQPRPIRYHRSNNALFDEDRNFVAAQDASMRAQHGIAPAPRPSSKIKSATDFPEKNSLPEKFSLQDSQQADIQNNKFSDPISLEDIDLTKDENRKLACIPSDGKYFIFDPDTAFDLVKRSANGKTIQNPITRAQVNISDIFTISAKQLTDFVAANQPQPAPRM